MSHRGSRRQYGHDAVVEDMGTGYSIDRDRPTNALRIALRVGAGASLTDEHRVKRAALKHMARLVAEAGERYDGGDLRDREYLEDGKRILEFVWARREAWARYDQRHDAADRRRVGNSGRSPGPVLVDAAGGAADVGGAGG